MNSPFEYELWAVPNKKTPLVSCPSGRLFTLEQGGSSKPRDIGEGEEKSVLFEGTACRLIRPGKKPIYFEVPTKPRPQNEVHDCDEEVVFY